MPLANKRGFVPVDLRTNKVAGADDGVYCLGAAPRRPGSYLARAGVCAGRACSPICMRYVRLTSLICHVGDACHTLVGPSMPHPKAGEFAWQMGTAVGAAIATAIAGGGDAGAAKRRGACFAETGRAEIFAEISRLDLDLGAISDVSRVNISPRCGGALLVEPDFTAVIADPDGGKCDLGDYLGDTPAQSRRH